MTFVVERLIGVGTSSMGRYWGLGEELGGLERTISKHANKLEKKKALLILVQ